MKRKFTFLITAALMLLTMMATTGTMWGQSTVTYTVASKTSVTTTGTAPTGSSATYSQTYNTMCQMTAGNSMTLTLSGYEGKIITGITLSMKSNSSKGAGSLSFTAGTTTLASIADAAFNTSSWYGSWSTTYVDVTPVMSNDSYEIQENENVVVSITASQNSLYCQSFTLTYEDAGASSLLDNDLALTDAPIALEFDLYNNNTAQVINYTTSSSGEVTIADNQYVETVIDEENETITVTPLLVTPSAQTITVNQATDGIYKAGSATFTVSITDNTPFAGGDVTFVAGTDVGSSTGQYHDEITKSGVTVSSTSAALASQQYRFYKNSVTTISTTSGKITKIVFTHCDNSYPVSNLSNLTDGTWIGEAESVQFTASAQARASQIVVTVTAPTSDPYITAANVDIDYDATGGNIEFTVNNEVTGGVISASTSDSWITLGSETTSPITFTCDANTEGTARTAEVTLTYTYNTTETVSKEVTITQAAAPVVYSTIPALFAAATSTETNVEVTFDNWVVSGVSTNGKSIFVTDNNGNGFVIYYTSDMSNTFAAGNVLSGTAVSCTLKLYNGFAELLNVNVADLTITDGGTVTETSIDMATLAGVNTGALLHYDNLTCSVTSDKYYLSDGTTTLQVFNSLYAFEALENGKTYNITGIYQQYNTTKEILPRSADDIEEVVPTEPTITVQPATVNSPFTGAEGTLTVTYENITTIVAEVKFYEADGVTEATYDWIDADINSSNNVDYIIDANTGEARSAYLKVYALGDDSQDVYSNLVTINQAEYVAPTYAELPFEFNDGKDDIEDTDGLSQEGLGTDYNESTNPTTKLKFDSTGDWVLLQFDERPGTLTFDIKNNSFSGGTFTVQTSEDGVTYTDLENYTTITGTQNEEFDNLGENVRYIKWIYTNKSSGNVGLGNIALAKYVAPVPSITVAGGNANIAVDADGVEAASLTLTYINLTITENTDFDIQYYDGDGNELGKDDQPDWMEASIQAASPEGYEVSYSVSTNDSDARTAYFKVYKKESEIYSNLVTVTQAAAAQTFTVNFTLDGGTFVPYGVFTDTIVEIEAGTYNLPSATKDGFEFAGWNDGNATYEADAEYTVEADVDFTAQWTEVVGVTYELVTSTDDIVPDCYYLITSGTNGSVKAMAGQTGNNRAAVAITASNGVITNPEGVVEFLISGSGTELNPYTIYDENVPGYLYAAGTGSSNYLKTQNEINARAQWTITINNNNQAIITALTTDTDRKIMRYNSSSGSNGVFSCYASGQQPIYLFKKVDNSPSITLSSYEIEAPAEPEAPATVITGSLTVTLNNITIEDLDQLGVDFCDENGELLSGPNTKPNWFDAEFELVNEEYKLNYTIQPSDVTEERIAYFKVFEIDSEAYSNLVTVTQEALVASITVDPDFVEAEAVETEDYLGITLTNIDITDVDNFDVYFCDEEGNIITDQESKPNWLLGEVQLVNEVFSLYYYIEENIVPEERIAYMKVYGMGDNGTTEAYSNIVTVTQAAAEYTVTFKVDDCTHGDTTGSSINLPTESTCTPDGFAIYGWALQNSIEAVANPYMPTADVTLYAILQLENVPSVMEKYVKVTEELTDWSGEYLIVYEAGNLAFDGSLTTLDAAQNTIEVTITNNTIEAYSTTDASKFTIAAYNNGYSIQSASGYYIGQTSDANGLSSSTETVYENAISYDTENECVDLVSSSTHLRYNTASNQERFRYYKSASYTNQQAIQLYKKTSEATTPTIVNVEYVSDTTEMTDTIPASTSYVVESGAVLTFTGTNEGTAANLVVQEGGQLIHTTDVEATVQKSVSGYTNKSGNGWYLIASPVDNYSTSTIATGTYDLFIYNEPNAYWYSSTGAAAPFNTLERGKGYLYANEANVNLNYAGTMKATDANIKVDLSYACDEYPYLKGFNLVGNPFTRNITAADMVIGDTAVTSYYDFNADRTEFVTYRTDERPIQPGQGFFIQAKGNAQQLEFNPAKSKDASDFKYISISAGDENFTDKAYIQFGYGNTLRKMTFGENTMVYVMNDDLDYAAARVEELAGTMPVHFVPIEDGFYTITVETKNIENLNYMHLIDNIKNTEIDLLVEPSYTFKASESDNADRFYLVFDFNNYTGVNENYTNDNFAHQIGDEIFVSGEGTLQVFDVLGRFVTGYNVNGDKRISTAEFNTGVYIFRMVGTEVKTQKIIVR